MLKFLEYNRPIWAPDDEGAGGGDTGGPASGGGATPDAGAGGDGQAPDGATGEGATGMAPRPSSILDHAARKTGEGEQAGEGGDWTPPEGMKVPPHMLQGTAEETLGKVLEAYYGKRKGIAEGQETGKVPDDPSGYTFDAGDGSDPVLADLASEESQPILDAWRKTAHELGIPDDMFRKFMAGGVKNMAEAGLKVSAAGEAGEGGAPQIDSGAEYDALVKEMGGKDRADAAVNQIDTFGLKLAQAGVLQSDEDLVEFSQMFGTAAATRIGQRMIVEMFGEKPIVPGDGVDGKMNYAEARAALDAANSLPKDDPTRQEKILAAEEALAAAGKGSQSGGGRTRSKVL